jgi:hypothetical protein
MGSSALVRFTPGGSLDFILKTGAEFRDWVARDQIPLLALGLHWICQFRWLTTMEYTISKSSVRSGKQFFVSPAVCDPIGALGAFTTCCSLGGAWLQSNMKFGFTRR